MAGIHPVEEDRRLPLMRRPIPTPYGLSHPEAVRDGCVHAGLIPVQLRFHTGLTSEEYVKQKAWESASLERCPHHPEGGCSFSRHTPYKRVEPPGTLIARWYSWGAFARSLSPDNASDLPLSPPLKAARSAPTARIGWPELAVQYRTPSSVSSTLWISSSLAPDHLATAGAQ
jgi:hypothetical protein